MDNGRGTTLYEYQLAMLHPMCDSAPAEAAALLDTLGATPADTAAAWRVLLEERRRTSVAEFEAAWGTPVWRRPNAPRPQLRSLADLTPWSCTAGELGKSVFGPLDYIDGFGGRGDLAAISAKDSDSGLDRLYWVNIDFGLLQSIEAPPEVYL